MSNDDCPFSYSESIPQQRSADILPVECPDCGAIRTPKSTRIGGREIAQYPKHPRLDGSTRARKHWKRIDGQWQIVEE